MTTSEANPQTEMPNGPGAAAILSAGIGCFAVAAFAIVADDLPSLKPLFALYKPTGPLSGVTSAAVLIWLVAWVILGRRWRMRNVALGRIGLIALALLGLSLLLTFPPLADLL
jgi:hypothetical protein